jgi:hypothetical protein
LNLPAQKTPTGDNLDRNDLRAVKAHINTLALPRLWSRGK